MTSLVLLLGATLARASAPVALDVDLARDLGDGLFSSGDAAGALQWYRVARWLEPTADELPGVQIRIALALEANGALTEAIGWYQRIDDGDVDFARLREGICISRNGAPSRGDVVLRELATAVPEDAPQVDLIRGTLWVEAGELDKAASAFAAVPTSHQDGATAAGLAASTGTLPHLKSPRGCAGVERAAGPGPDVLGRLGRRGAQLGLGWSIGRRRHDADELGPHGGCRVGLGHGRCIAHDLWCGVVGECGRCLEAGREGHGQGAPGTRR